MNSAISSALSGLMASTMRLNTSASNIANAQTGGVLPATPPSRPVAANAGGGPQVYQAVTTLQSAGPQGGVSAQTAPVLPSYVAQYDPSAPYANADGLVAAPTVDLASEAVNLIVARHSYQANLATIRTAEEMDSSLLDVLG